MLAVLPTGSGKSLCFQVPALLDSGMTVVVSPLISLMQDQVDALSRRGIRAAALTSVTSPRERVRISDAIRSGDITLLYVSPERLLVREFLRLLTASRVTRLAVDEAHCISEWGHDFRPAYRRIASFRRIIGRPPCLALTATATPETRDDISESLRLRSPRRIVASVNRRNLLYRVVRTRRRDETVRRVSAAVPSAGGATIVYVPTRQRSVRLCEVLKRRGIAVEPYHAGLPAGTRQRVQERFLGGELRAVCATSAFGMGIDHPSVRLVCHMGLPGSLESYVQQAGRAGRDGETAECLLVASRTDGRVQRSLIQQSWPSGRSLVRVYEALPPGPVSLRTLRQTLRHLPEPELRAALRLLEQFGCVRRTGRSAGPRVVYIRGRSEPRRLEFEVISRGRRRAWWRFSEMRRYASAPTCRRAAIARYFGESAPRCTGCDRCPPGLGGS